MFCPRCGNTLVLKHYENGIDELYCVQGNMGLSLGMQRKLEERYGPHASSQSPQSPQSPNPPNNAQFHRGLKWFCPGDGEKLNDQLECPECGKHVRDLVYQLIEYHPHEKDSHA